MLILCCGPDSFRALARAKELEFAFKRKHDPEGHAVEHLTSGKEGVDEVVSKAAGASLFSPRRFLRADGIISNCPKAKLKTLHDALARDVESMIVVSVEEEKPTSSILKNYEDLPKIVVCEYPLLRGKEFIAWAKEHAKTIGNIDEITVHALADRFEGDCWAFHNEGLKIAAGGILEGQNKIMNESVYDIADHILKNDKEKYFAISKNDFGYSEMSVLLQQTTAAIRVRDRDVAGLAPFVVRKLQSGKILNVEVLLGAVLKMLFLQRAGFSNEEESTTLIP